MVDTSPTPPRGGLKGRAFVGLAAVAPLVVATVAAGVAWVLASRDNGGNPPPDDHAGRVAAADSSAQGPISSSCIQEYSLDTLADRETAFDGTVASVDGDEVTFTVNHWYSADQGDEITLAGASTLSVTTSAGDSVNLEAGARLLVAGDGGFAWSCGFTQPYDAAVAGQWASTFAYAA